MIERSPGSIQRGPSRDIHKLFTRCTCINANPCFASSRRLSLQELLRLACRNAAGESSRVGSSVKNLQLFARKQNICSSTSTATSIGHWPALRRTRKGAFSSVMQSVFSRNMVPTANADESIDPLLLAEGGKASLTHVASIAAQPRESEAESIRTAEDPLLANTQSSILGTTKSDLLEAIDGRALAGEGTANQLQTVFNILNLYMGIGVFLIGHAVALGGWATLLFLFLFSGVFCFSAQLLCASFEKLPAGATPSFPALGFLAGGVVGQWAVLLISVTEFFGDTCILLISIWQSVAVLFPGSGGICLGPICLDLRQSVILATLLALLPAIWLRGFSKLTVIAVSGVVSSLMLTAVMVGTVAIDPTSARVSGEGSHQHTILRAASLPTGVGVMLVSLSGHQSLPSLKRSMRRPQHFEKCLYIAFGSMFLLYSLMGALTYQYFGESCDVLVTNNLMSSSAISGWVVARVGAFQIGLAQLLSALLALSAFSTTPPLVLVLGDLLIDMTHGGTSQGHVSILFETCLRTTVLLLAYAVAMFFYDVLGLLLSLVGGIASMCSSLLLPSLFYFLLHQNETSRGHQIVVGAVICLGAASAIFIGIMNIHQLWNK